MLPIHHGYTSQYATVIWGAYGFHLYLLHDTLGSWGINRQKSLVLWFSIEALFAEAILVIASKIVFGEFFYYYYPGDLWHVSSIQNLPFYFLCGRLIHRTLSCSKNAPLGFSVLFLWLTIILVFIV